MDINASAFIPDVGLPTKSEAPTVTPLSPGAPTTGAGGSATNGATEEVRTFKDTLSQALSDVNDRINTSDQNVKDLAEGKTNDLNMVITSVEEANLALQYTIAVRGKVLDAYQEISRITV